MKFFSENIEDLRTLYVADLKRALDIEQKITKALPTSLELVTHGDRSNLRECPRAVPCGSVRSYVD